MHRNVHSLVQTERLHHLRGTPLAVETSIQLSGCDYIFDRTVFAYLYLCLANEGVNIGSRCIPILERKEACTSQKRNYQRKFNKDYDSCCHFDKQYHNFKAIDLLHTTDRCHSKLPQNRKAKIFRCFQRAQKESSVLKWVKPLHLPVLLPP